METEKCDDDSCRLDIYSELRKGIRDILAPYHAQQNIWHQEHTNKAVSQIIELIRKFNEVKSSPPDIAI
jgi:hypothetical protein